jgi:Homeodomain-like domain
VADRNRPLKHVQRAHIVLCSADRLPVQEVARRAGVSRPAVWRWQARHAEQGVDGLLRDKTRNSDSRPFVRTTSAKAIFEKLAQIAVPSVRVSALAPDRQILSADLYSPPPEDPNPCGVRFDLPGINRRADVRG